MILNKPQDCMILHYKAEVVDPQIADVSPAPKSAQLPEEDTSGNPVLGNVLNDLRQAQHAKGPNHCDVGEAWNALGLVRVHMERNVEAALDCHKEALRIYQGNSNEKEIAVTLNDIGFCFEQIGNSNEALRCHKSALNILKRLDISENHPRMQATERAIARIERN